jgi:hypothetical protein
MNHEYIEFYLNDDDCLLRNDRYALNIIGPKEKK